MVDAHKPSSIEDSSGEIDDFTPEEVLTDASVLSEEGGERSLNQEFEKAWRAALVEIRQSQTDTPVREKLASLVNVDPGQLSFERFGGESQVIARSDGQAVGQWVSDAALMTDVAAASVLSTWYENWAQLDVAFRGTVLTNLRLFVPECPLCGSETTFEEEETGCCGSSSSYTLRCTDCETVIYQVDKDAIDAARE